MYIELVSYGGDYQVIINGEPTYVLNKTCGACPEQYDMFDINTHNKVAYFRFRYSSFTVSVPDYGGEVVYHKHIGDGYQGIFDDEEQRIKELMAAIRAVYHYEGGLENEKV